jgi:hypothetical protein
MRVWMANHTMILLVGALGLFALSWVSVRSGSPQVASPFPLAVIWPLLAWISTEAE